MSREVYSELKKLLEGALRSGYLRDIFEGKISGGVHRVVCGIWFIYQKSWLTGGLGISMIRKA